MVYTYQFCKALNKVVFEKGIALDRISGPETSIAEGDGVFFYCTSLESIEIPASVEIIGKRAFAYSGLRTITFESGSKLKRICGGATSGAYYGAFYSSRIKSIIIPKSVEIIEDAAFLNSSLEEVTFEKGSALKQLGGGYSYGFGHGAFQGTSIKSIVIPAGVTEIKPATFENCKELERVSFEQGSQLIIIRGLEGNSALDYSPHGAFMDCCNLTSIDIPSSVEGIDYAAFSGCTNLKNITFGENSSLKFIAGGSHSYNGGITNMYYGAFNNCTSLVSITIPANVKSIGEVAFKGCSNLETVVFAPSAKISAIAHGAFEEATKLWYVDMSEAKNINLIDDFAFAGCPILIFKIGASTPPRCGTNTFDSISDHSVLKVPTASVDIYKSSHEWSQFTNISGIDD